MMFGNLLKFRKSYFLACASLILNYCSNKDNQRTSVFLNVFFLEIPSVACHLSQALGGISRKGL